MGKQFEVKFYQKSLKNQGKKMLVRSAKKIICTCIIFKIVFSCYFVSGWWIWPETRRPKCVIREAMPNLWYDILFPESEIADGTVGAEFGRFLDALKNDQSFKEYIRKSTKYHVQRLGIYQAGHQLINFLVFQNVFDHPCICKFGSRIETNGSYYRITDEDL